LLCGLSNQEIFGLRYLHARNGSRNPCLCNLG
jgi:hypothetical protein